MDTKGTIATVLGIIALFAFGIFAYHLAKHISDGQQQWDRLVYIFGGVEAVAFAAAGFFFGKEVHRARAETAEDKAKEAEKSSKQDHAMKSVAETKLSSLIKYIETQAPSSSERLADLEDIRNFARQPGIGEKSPSLLAAIETKHSFIKAKAVPDERWANLLHFAKSL